MNQQNNSFGGDTGIDADFIPFPSDPPVNVKRFSIDGYWKDNKSKFSSYVVQEDETVYTDDDDIFFYGLSEKEIKKAIKLKEDTEQEFVITAYRRI